MVTARVSLCRCTFWLLLVACVVTGTASDLSTVEVQDGTDLLELNDTNSTTGTLNEMLQSTENSTLGTEGSFAKTEELRNSTIEDTHLPTQIGPLVDIFGQQLLSLEMMNDTSAALRPRLTSDALRGKKVIGLYFSADWCGPCRKFTPELVSFYKKMNQRRGKKDEFEIVWISRCRDVHAYGQYFTQMGGWLALPPEEAMGARGSMLSDKYKVKGIPSLVLLDDLGQVITRDGRNKIPQDKAGIGFPWRNPIATLYMTVIPRSLRLLIRMQVESVMGTIVTKVQSIFDETKRKQKVSHTN
jgi:nucleoredoxin